MPESATQEIYFNQWDPEFRANPYPHYKPMLAGPPRIINITIPATPDMLKMFGLEGADIKEIPLPTGARDALPGLPGDFARPAAFFQRAPRASEGCDSMEQRGPFKGATTMLFSDPPVHTRLRKLVSRDFTPRRIREMEPRIRELTNMLLDEAKRTRRF